MNFLLSRCSEPIGLRPENTSPIMIPTQGKYSGTLRLSVLYTFPVHGEGCSIAASARAGMSRKVSSVCLRRRVSIELRRLRAYRTNVQ